MARIRYLITLLFFYGLLERIINRRGGSDLVEWGKNFTMVSITSFIVVLYVPLPPSPRSMFCKKDSNKRF